MACTGLDDCLPENPLPPGAPGRDLNSLEAIGGFAINAAIYFAYAFLMIAVFWWIGIAIYQIIFSEDSEAPKIARVAMTRAVAAIIGMVLVTGVLFIIAQTLALIGLSDAEIRSNFLWWL